MRTNLLHELLVVVGAAVYDVPLGCQADGGVGEFRVRRYRVGESLVAGDALFVAEGRRRALTTLAIWRLNCCCCSSGDRFLLTKNSWSGCFSFGMGGFLHR